MNIIFENDSLIAIDKPAGFLSVPSRWGKKDPRPCLGTLIQEKCGQNIFPVHRLDEETTGVILYAKNPQIHKILNQAFEKHLVQKIYHALTENPQKQKIVERGNLWRDFILRGKKRAYASPVGQRAETLIQKCSKAPGDLLLWELHPLTGRSHQLRYQLASRHFPILGDRLYGSEKALPTDWILPPESLTTGGIALRASSLDLTKIESELANFKVPLVFKASSKIKIYSE